MTGPTAEVTVRRARSFTLRFDPDPLVLPDDVAAAVDAYWAERVAREPYLYNGPTLMLTSLAGDEDVVGEVRRSTYAHKLAAGDGAIPQEWRPRHAFVSVLVITRDGYVTLGQMSPRTALPGKFLLPGGGIDPADVRDGVVDLRAGAARELREEVGIEEELTPWGVFDIGAEAAFGFVFAAQSRRDRSELRAEFGRWNEAQRAAGEEPELTRLAFARTVFELETDPVFAEGYLAWCLPELFALL